MHILLTGGAGFIGSHIADAYIGAGHSVSIIDNFTTGLRANLNPAARLHEIDIRDRRAVERVFAEERFDLLNHHAAQLNVRVSVSDPQFDAEQNVIGTLNLLQGALVAGVRRVIFASSGGTVYGEQVYFPADERHPTDPIAPYGITKLAVEKYLNPRGLRILDALDKAAKQYGSTPGQIAIAWQVARPSITAPIASATSTGQLSELIAAAQMKLDAGTIAALDAASVEDAPA